MEIIEFEELDSTNTYLKLNHEKYNDFTVVNAIKQTNGRGRFDSIWESKNDLTFSILFKKSYKHYLISPLVVNNVLQRYGFNSSIKWPNDILVDNIKTSGILIEKVYSNNNCVCIVGIGINIEKRDDYNYLNNIDKKKLLIDIILEYKKYIKYDNDLLKQEYIKNCSIFKNKIIYNKKSYFVVDMLDNGELSLENDYEKVVVDCNKIDYKKLINK